MIVINDLTKLIYFTDSRVTNSCPRRGTGEAEQKLILGNRTTNLGGRRK